MEDLTPEEVMAMRGTEFTYILADGDTIPAFIAQAELGKGLTCKALQQCTVSSYPMWLDRDVIADPKEYDNIICYPTDRLDLDKHIQRVLKEILSTGCYTTIPQRGGSMSTCSFN